jgi:hypothetical protein
VAGAIALALLLLALAGFVGLLPWSLALLGLEFVVVDAARSEPALAAAFYGTGLLLSAELAYASRELARGREEELERRVSWVAVVAAGALATGLIPVAATLISTPGGPGAELVALAGAVALLGVPALLVLRRQPTPREANADEAGRPGQGETARFGRSGVPEQ